MVVTTCYSTTLSDEFGGYSKDSIITSSGVIFCVITLRDNRFGDARI